MQWKRIAHQYRAQEQEQVFLVMSKRDPVEIDATTYLFEADNTIQAGRLEAIMEELMGYLRAAVKNYDVRIKIEVAASTAEDPKYLTGKDKFERLSRLNTNLLDFKNRFNLDIEP